MIWQPDRDTDTEIVIESETEQRQQREHIGVCMHIDIDDLNTKVTGSHVVGLDLIGCYYLFAIISTRAHPISQGNGSFGF